MARFDPAPPVGEAANVYLSVSCHNFGVQEVARRHEKGSEVCPGAPELRDGCLWPNEAPGLGVDFDEHAAAKYPPDDREGSWPPARRPDGTISPP